MAAGVQKARMHEVAGSLALAVQRALWGFDGGAELEGGCYTDGIVPADLHSGEIGSLERASRQVLGTDQRAQGTSNGLTGSREIAAGVGPAHRNGVVARLKGGLAHDVSTLLGVGRHLGSQPRANTSITIMRPPQRGQGQGSARGVSVAISGGSCGSAAGGATLRSARAFAMFSARLALAKSP